MFRSPKDHPQGVRQALLQLPLCTIIMYAYVGMWEHALGIKLCP